MSFICSDLKTSWEWGVLGRLRDRMRVCWKALRRPSRCSIHFQTCFRKQGEQLRYQLEMTNLKKMIFLLGLSSSPFQPLWTDLLNQLENGIFLCSGQGSSSQWQGWTNAKWPFPATTLLFLQHLEKPAHQPLHLWRIPSKLHQQEHQFMGLTQVRNLRIEGAVVLSSVEINKTVVYCWQTLFSKGHGHIHNC